MVFWLMLDPWVDRKAAVKEHNITMISKPTGHYDAILLAVAHDVFKLLGADGVRAFGKTEALFYDMKSVFTAVESDLRL